MNNLNKQTKSEEHFLYTVESANARIYKGSVLAKEQQKVASVSKHGEIETIHVNSGDIVEVGTPLVTYKNQELQLAVDDQKRALNHLYDDLNTLQNKQNIAIDNHNAAQADVDALNQQLADIKQAGKVADMESFSKAISQSEMLVQSNRSKAEAYSENIEQLIKQINELSEKIDAQSALVNYVEKAKFKGVVQRDIANKDLPNSTVLTVLSSDVIITSSVNEYDYAKLKLNKPVTISVASTEEKIAGHIVFVDKAPATYSNESVKNTDSFSFGGNATTQTSAQYTFHVVPDKPIQYGFSVEITLEDELIYLPSSMVLKEDNHYYVFVEDNGKAKKKEIVVEEVKDQYRLKSGLTKGDRIFQEIDDLADGKAVTVHHD